MNESQVFLNALKRTPAERAAYLDEACAGDPRLRADVEALLRAHETDPGFLEQPASARDTTLDLANTSDSPGATTFEVGGEQPGTVLAGRYTLVELIGQGGMGSVWLSRQTEPVKRSVAVKLIKPGMDSAAVLARFEAERQALALMDHPNIAKVLDGGTTADSRPFFVMELVKGVPITAYCDEHRLTLRRRLELFASVCDAVQHAHQKGIIHRDLKPNNVLVGEGDGKVVPKVIDFGIAKATGEPLTDKTLFTGLGGVIGTPEYMSPEQAELNNRDIDTRSDVYSLGVLLYELLTGTTPLEGKRSKDTPLLELLRLVREEEPARPSSRLSAAREPPSVADRRGAEPAKLARQVRGELDWIVMKALEKDRNRRYDTAGAFAADLRRHLAREPVLAVPPTRGYRLRKFARRNRAALAAAAAVGAGVVVAIVALAVSNDRLGREQQLTRKAQEDTDKALAAETQANKDLQASLVREQASVARERRNLYDYVLRSARRDWLNGDLDQARKNLLVCPDELRDRNWEFLSRVCNAERLRIAQATRKLRYSPDGKLLVGLDLGTPTVWDATTGRPDPRFLSVFVGGIGRRFVAAAFTPDGKELVLATDGVGTFSPLQQKPSHPGFNIRVWDFAKMRATQGLTREGAWGKAILSPDASRVLLVTAQPDWGVVAYSAAAPPQYAAVCDPRTAREFYRLALPGNQILAAAAFHPDGRVLTVSSPDHAIRFWDGGTGKLGRQLDLGEAVALGNDAVGVFVLSPDGSRFAAVHRTKNAPERVRVGDLETGREVAVVQGHTGSIDCLALNPGGTRLATGGRDKAVTVWALDSGRELWTFRGHSAAITALEFSPDGARLASCDGATVRVWDVAAEK